MKAYSDDLKMRVINYYNNNCDTLRSIAKIFMINKSTVYRWVTGKNVKIVKKNILLEKILSIIYEHCKKIL